MGRFGIHIPIELKRSGQEGGHDVPTGLFQKHALQPHPTSKSPCDSHPRDLGLMLRMESARVHILDVVVQEKELKRWCCPPQDNGVATP
jgi:hypothetical protein